jgi:peroxiredoxin
MMNRKLISSVVAGLLTVGLVGIAGTAYAGDKAKGDKHENKAESAMSGVKVGDTAPDFTLTGTDGKTYTLSEWTKKGNIVVLEWFNAECPFCVKHGKEGTMKKLQADYKDKGVVLLGINSGGKGKPGYGKDAEAVKDWGLNYPILADESGKVGKEYGAKTTPHMFIIGKDGKVAYMGAIDDQKEGGKNYVRQALDQILKGETVTEASTKPYGCGVKYGS